MHRSLALAIVVSAAASPALAKPALVTITRDGKTVAIPKGYKAAIGERCLSISGPGSLYVYRTVAGQEEFEKAEAGGKAKRVARDNAICFERKQPGENARCLITTPAGNWITQFVSFGKKYSAIGGAATMAAIVTSIKGWEPQPYDGMYALGNDCPAVK